MELSALQNLSPTLLEGMLHTRQKNISKGLTVFNTRSKLITAFSVLNKETGECFQFTFDDLPEEFRRAIHDYTTRLSAEKLLIETALDNSKVSIP